MTQVLADRPSNSGDTTHPAGPPAISVTAHGTPAPQGSKKPFRNQYTGRIHLVEQSNRVKPWRQDVKHAALAAVDSKPGWTPLDGPLAVSMTFTFSRPKSHYRTGRNAHLLKDSAPTRHASTPDLSKLLRSTEDALTGVVWVDDARVTEYVRLGKWFASVDAPDVLITPGCVIRVWSLR